MSQITINLPDAVYERLVSEAKAAHRCVEDVVTERIKGAFRRTIATSEKAHKRCEDILRSHAGHLLKSHDAQLGDDLIWNIDVVANIITSEPNVVGCIKIDAKSCELLNSLEDIMGMIRAARDDFGISPFPSEKQTRLSELLAANSQGKLSDSEEKELDQLLYESQEKSAENLEQIAAQIQVPSDEKDWLAQRALSKV